MSSIAEVMRSFLGAGSDVLEHYGVGHEDDPPGPGSGRWPYGSGKVPYQHIGQEWLDIYKELLVEKTQGKITETEMAEELHAFDFRGKPSPTVMRAMKSAATNKVKAQAATKAKELFESGKSYSEIAKILGVSYATAKSYLDGSYISKAEKAEKLAEELKQIINDRGILDVGAGVAQELGCSNERLDTAVYILESEGYAVSVNQLKNLSTKNRLTTYSLIGPPGTTKEEFRDPEKWNSILDFKFDNEKEQLEPAYRYPASMDSSRIMVRYAEDGGLQQDGYCEVRRGVPDLDLGNNYCQLRVLVDGTHYIKGMAGYGDNMPEGIDLIFNTNKKRGTPMLGEDGNTVLKPISEDDPSNPFGSTIKDIQRGGQYTYTDEYGVEHLGLINKRADSGDWYDWSKNLPSQFLAKQPMETVQKQLNLSIADKKAELEEIMQMPNPTLKNQMLMEFAGKCDTASTKLFAAAMPGQSYHVFIPLTTIADDQVFAPNYPNGQKVAVIRFPHAGPQEIPLLTVNNTNKEGISRIGKNAVDAIGISAKAAAQMSGADFDGDAGIVIPVNGKVRIRTEKAIKELQEFDPKYEYALPYDPEKKVWIGKQLKTEKAKGMEMGKISNLITDMVAQGVEFDDPEMTRAIKHSMVVIDAKKHHLDYKRSERENGIDELKRKYQQHEYDDKYGGASTILSRAKSPATKVPKRQGSGWIDDEGNIQYKKAWDYEYIDKKTGKVKYNYEKDIPKMMVTDDAMSLVSASRNPIEIAYANYANELKDLAREARKTVKNTKDLPYDKHAYETYKEDVDTLWEMVSEAERNRVRERGAQAVGNAQSRKIMAAWDEKHPNATSSERNKERGKVDARVLKEARTKYNSKRAEFTITDRQWDAINRGALSSTRVKKLLRYVNRKELLQRSLPRTYNELSPAKQNMIKALERSGYTNDEIAERVGCSKTTVIKYMKGDV